MILAADVFTASGTLLVARGHEVTPGLVRRLENFAASLAPAGISVMADEAMEPARRSATGSAG